MDERGLEARVGQQLRPCELHVSELLLKCVSKNDLHCPNMSVGQMSCRCVRFEAFFTFAVFAMIATQSTLRECRTFDQQFMMNGA